MSTNLIFPWISLSILAPLMVAIFGWFAASADKMRRWAIGSLLVSEISLLAALAELFRKPAAHLIEPWPINSLSKWFGVDSLNAILLPLFAALSLGLMILAPKRKVTPRWISGVLLLTSAALATYAANNILIIALGFAISTAPFLINKFFAVKGEKEIPPLSKLALALSVVCMAAGIALIFVAFPGNGEQTALNLMVPRLGNKPILQFAFWLLIAAAFIRKGMLPAHSWLLASYQRGPLLPLTLLINSHLGAFVVARLAIPLLPDVARQSAPIIVALALITAAYTAILALIERQPRRLLALLSISQGAFILVGLACNQVEGIAGALLHWQVVAITTTILISVYTGLEARMGSPIDGKQFLGLAAHAPRLAVFFAIAGLALIGLPLTIGFCAEDLLLHGTLSAHPRLGIVMPIVTALNAFQVMRLFAIMFLGPTTVQSRGLSDALPRERWVLTAALLFLIAGGLAPSHFIQLHLAAAKQIAALLEFSH
jgi:NADH-quinone oxidoreductase subunit M